MNCTSFSAWNYYLTYYFPTPSLLAEITHPFTGAELTQLKNANRYICLPFPFYRLNLTVSLPVWESQ